MTGDTGEAVTGAKLIPEIHQGKKVRVAVVGAGDFGRNHARVYREIADAELIGIVDANPERAGQIAKEFSTEVIPDFESLAGRVDGAVAGYRREGRSAGPGAQLRAAPGAGG